MYKFPEINSIDDVLPAIKDKPEFIVAERDNYTVINYIIASNFPKVQTNEDAILRECRGIIFDKKGKLISRPFHKFFNIGEKEETLIENLSDKDILILDKIDGSMIRPLKLNGDVFWSTKMGCTDVAQLAEQFTADKPNYKEFARECVENDVTPLFELCTNKQRIIIDHQNDSLTLIAIRNNILGTYIPYCFHKKMLKYFNIPFCVGKHHKEINLEEFYNSTKKDTGYEGYVLRYPSDFMVKIKTNWYVTIHSAKESILFEKNIIKMILDNNLDDVKGYLPEEDKQKIEEYEKAFVNGFMKFTEDLWETYWFYYQNTYTDKKEFAINYSSLMTNQFIKGAILNNWHKDRFALTEYCKQYILKNLTSTKLDQIRYMWNSIKWRN